MTVAVNEKIRNSEDISAELSSTLHSAKKEFEEKVLPNIDSSEIENLSWLFNELDMTPASVIRSRESGEMQINLDGNISL